MNVLSIRNFLFFGLAVLSGVVLLYTSQSVQRAEHRVAALEKEIAYEQDRIRMLKAEWAHLNRPERLEKLAKEFLDMVPPRVEGASDVVKTDVPELEVEPLMRAPVELQPVSLKPQPKSKPVPAQQSEGVQKDFGDVLEGLEVRP